MCAQSRFDAAALRWRCRGARSTASCKAPDAETLGRAMKGMLRVAAQLWSRQPDLNRRPTVYEPATPYPATAVSLSGRAGMRGFWGAVVGEGWGMAVGLPGSC